MNRSLGWRFLAAGLLFLSLSGCALSPTAAPADRTPIASDLPAATRTPNPTAMLPPISPVAPPTIIPCDLAGASFCVQPGSFTLQAPIPDPARFPIDRTYAYGSTAGGTREPHHGVEFPVPGGTPVLAAAAGSVIFAGDDHTTLFSPWADFYGSLVVLEHPLPSGTIFTLYAHLSQVLVTPGQPVQAGDSIAVSGVSGAAIGSHLHFEVRQEPYEYASTLNPELYLLPKQDEGVLAVRAQTSAGSRALTDLVLQYIPEGSSTIQSEWQLEQYPVEPAFADQWEDHLLGALPSGRYRLVYLWQGAWLERWVEVHPQALTFILLTLDP